MKRNLSIFVTLFFLPITLAFLPSCEKDLQVKKIKVNDVELAYYKRGSGDPLVMIMGYKGTMSAWDPALLDELSKTFTLILFDNRGAGFSSDTEENLTTIQQMAKDTEALIKSLGIQQAHVLGWSMGSRTALQMAIDYPDLVKTVILSATNPGGQYQAKRLGNAFEKLSQPNLKPEDYLALLYPETPQGLNARKQYMARLDNAIKNGTIPNDLTISEKTAERQKNALKLWGEDDSIYDKLPSIKVPVLVTGGRADVLSNPENAQIIASRIPLAWLAYFEGGHGFISQNYNEFSALVNLFVEANP